MSDHSLEYLLDALRDTCVARSWAVEIAFHGGNLAASGYGAWSAVVCEDRGGYRAIVPEVFGATLHEALEVLWNAVKRHCRALAARGSV